ncbi:diacylglycerol kinase family protein [Tumidithrix elongata RA019]|uniref:Diacylglycerol kinase family protein n=1 Tax=Tumidithrix elongata BACA0141 TaxID=2716417 RepID=A0AAW9Q0M5_9CYAN|nr:diacylglycerol kinase family protein [Tumidithrix elongata RA019]
MAANVTSQSFSDPSLSETSQDNAHLSEPTSDPDLRDPNLLDLKSSNLPVFHTPSLQVATSLRLSFKFAGEGIAYTFKTQRNFRIHLVMGVLVLGLSLYIQLPKVDFAIISLTIAAILMMELLNTALEAVVDLTVGKTYHQQAKVAKDCAAGAVLVSAIAAVVVGSALILPRMLVLLNLI